MKRISPFPSNWILCLIKTQTLQRMHILQTFDDVDEKWWHSSDSCLRSQICYTFKSFDFMGFNWVQPDSTPQDRTVFFPALSVFNMVSNMWVGDSQHPAHAHPDLKRQSWDRNVSRPAQWKQSHQKKTNFKGGEGFKVKFLCVLRAKDFIAPIKSSSL